MDHAKHSPHTRPRREHRQEERLIGKTLVWSAVVTITNVVGNYGLSRGLHRLPPLRGWSPIPYIESFEHFWVLIGVAFMLAWLISRLALLSWADLTYVLPVTSFSYVLSALAGVWFLNESVNVLHWLGICVISIGAGLVGFSNPNTTQPPTSAEL